ncbi:nicotinamide riboside kinase 1-like protein [Cricetulus griseus]|uniref:Nicotinamide riboside kinase 1-like protein n=1 Tax=Cricetulus griseus TaxID=10029 RepID=A0A061I6X9_CRIGR|nr:nicotinamide riboside kinase 1-like protein [Cricetulus griseus]
MTATPPGLAWWGPKSSTRVYEPPDPPGYFDGHVWPMYLKHRQEMNTITWNIVYLDGTRSEEDLLSQVFEDIKQELEKQTGKYCSIKSDGGGKRILRTVHCIPVSVCTNTNKERLSSFILCLKIAEPAIQCLSGS